MLEEDFHHGFRVVDVVIRVQLKFLEQRVLAHEILHGIFEGLDDTLQVFAARWLLDVEDDFILDSQFPGDRQGIFG